MSTPRQALPHPDELASRDRLAAWLVEMRAKFAVDGNAIGGEGAQFFYVFSRLGTFRNQFLPYVSSVTTYEGQPESFLEKVRMTLGDPFERRCVGLSLVALRQRRGEGLSEYLARFDQTAHVAGAAIWPDDCKILLLVNGLAAPARVRLDCEEWPEEFEKFCKALRRFEGVFSAAAGEENTRSQGADAMDIDIAAVSAGGVKCYACGRTGHYKRNCPNRRERTKVQLLSIGPSEEDENAN